MSRLQAALRHRERGVALVMVLWVLILLGLIAASFLRETRLSTNVARNITENAKAEALAEAGIRRAMLGLLDPDPTTAWRVDGTAYQFALGEGSVVIQIQDEAGKLDLSRAPAPLLLGLFEAVGVDPEMAAKLADTVYDFRDSNHERRTHGAEDLEYLAAGLDYGAKDAPLDDKEELMQVLGMTREIYDAVRPYVTVHSGTSRINLMTAPEFVLRAIPNLTPDQLDKILADRVNGTRRQSAPAEVVMVRAKAVTRAGGVFIREAVMKRSEDAEHPFEILEWRHEWGSVQDVGKMEVEPQ